MKNNHLKDITLLRNFADNYGAGYGNANLYEVGNRFILITYNGGWSSNEEDEEEFILNIKNSSIISLKLSDHPCHIFVIKKSYFSMSAFFVNICDSEFDCLRKLDCYSKRKKFFYKLK